MKLTLYYHPLSSFCHKALMALYENDTPFTGEIVNLGDKEASARFFALWPLGKIPVLRDEALDRTVPETTIIIEYLDARYPGPQPLLPRNDDQRLEARLWDRFFDLHVHIPMQKLVADHRRPQGEGDPRGVAETRSALRTAYDMLDKRMSERTWAIGDSFSIADCAAAPALFYAGIVVPFSETHPHLSAYFDRLAERPSFKRLIVEARPYFKYFPFSNLIPARFL
ncbi:MAG: glutathione S-transferase family protein [Gammaproteobacteria bacterium]